MRRRTRIDRSFSLAGLLAIGLAGLTAGCDKPAANSTAPAATTQPQRRVPDKPVAPDADAPLVESFTKHRAAFDELRSMILADGALTREVRAGAEATKPEGMSDERHRRYLVLLEEAGATAVSTQAEELIAGEVLFEVAAPSTWPADSRAYVLYAEATGLQRVDLVAERLAAGHAISVARELAVNWYLVGRN